MSKVRAGRIRLPPPGLNRVNATTTESLWNSTLRTDHFQVVQFESVLTVPGISCRRTLVKSCSAFLIPGSPWKDSTVIAFSELSSFFEYINGDVKHPRRLKKRGNKKKEGPESVSKNHRAVNFLSPPSVRIQLLDSLATIDKSSDLK